MTTLRISILALFVALTTFPADAQPESHGAAFVGGGALFADPPAGSAPDAGSASVPMVMLGARTFDIIVFGFYGQIDAVSLAEATDEEIEAVAPTEALPGYGIGIALGATLGFGEPGNTPYILGGIRGLDRLAYTGIELGAGYLVGIGDRFALLAEVGVVLTEDSGSDPLFVRGGLGFQIDS